MLNVTDACEGNCKQKLTGGLTLPEANVCQCACAATTKVLLRPVLQGVLYPSYIDPWLEQQQNSRDVWQGT